VAHGVDAPMHPMQPSPRDSSSDRRLLEPERGELPHAHDAVLAGGHIGKRGWKPSHTDG
jgi:hypothetical protein